MIKSFVPFCLAGGGMGKSTAMKYLAISWADGTADELKKFDFVFHIALKKVKDDSQIENIIVEQHAGLKARELKPAEVKCILEGDTDGKIMLILDGHDEYTVGRNSDIDGVIMKEKLWNCWMILTSRETDQIKDFKQYMDAEVELYGFIGENAQEYATKTIGNKEETETMLKQAVDKGLCHWDGKKTFFLELSFLYIPIFLHMICVMFRSEKSLPDTSTGILQAIVERCIQREAIRGAAQRTGEGVQRALFNLGRLAWGVLNAEGKLFSFEKVRN